MCELTLDELTAVDGGGVISCVAGGVAFAMIGAIVSLPIAVATGDASVVGHTAILAGSVGMWVGAGCPLP